MDRRSFLGTITGSAALIAGCVSSPETRSGTGSNRGGIAEYEFQVGWPDDREPLKEGYTHAATVETKTNPPKFLVLGQLASESRSCKKTVLDRLDYDDETLEVEIFDENTASEDESCTMEEAVVCYELRVSFEETSPTTVEVFHRKDGRGRVFSETIQVS